MKRNSSTWTRSIVLLALFIALFTLAGCSGASEVAEANDTVTQTPSPTPHVPTLTLAGEDVFESPCGIPFVEPGYSAISPEGRDITADVVCTGEVDCMTPGEYPLSYGIRFDGEYYEVTRTVRVTEVGYPESVEPTKKVLYLTFDDGPCANTPELLDTLARHNAKATFFVITGNNPYLDTILPQISDAGHSIGVHCVCHEYDTLYSSSSYYLNDLISARERVHELTGEYVSLCRFPGGSTTAYHKLNNREKDAWNTVTAQLERMGIQYVDWNVGPENDTNNATSSLSTVKSFVPKYSVPVTLQHDTRLYSVKAVESILQWGEENGYTFLGLDTTVPAVHAN